MMITIITLISIAIIIAQRRKSCKIGHVDYKLQPPIRNANIFFNILDRNLTKQTNKQKKEG